MVFACLACGKPLQLDYQNCPGCGEPIDEFAREYWNKPVGGDYELVEKLGRGGMGNVYKARHLHLDSYCVIKVTRPGVSADGSLEDRFQREARVARKIQHRNVAMLYQFSKLPNGAYFMVWEYIEGENLGRIIRRRGALPPAEVLEISIQALDGLEAIHRAGFVHRDISPDNVMITADDSSSQIVKIIDLGIAKHSTESGETLTAAGMFLGKFKYSSPEHIGLIAADERIDGRADLYSFGLVMYEMLAGSAPFVASTPGEYVMKHTMAAPPPLPPERLALPGAAEMQGAIFKALEKERKNRYASAAAFAQILRELRNRPELGMAGETTPPALSAPSVPNTSIPHTSVAHTATTTPGARAGTPEVSTTTIPRTMTAASVDDDDRREADAAVEIGRTAASPHAAERVTGLGVLAAAVLVLVLLAGVIMIVSWRRHAPTATEPQSSTQQQARASETAAGPTEAASWSLADKGSAADLENYLKAYPSGPHRALAVQRLSQLQDRGTTDQTTSDAASGPAATGSQPPANLTSSPTANSSSTIDPDVRLAESGDLAASVRLGAQYQKKATSDDLRTSASWYLKAATLGDAEAQYRYAWLMGLGRGVQRDIPHADYWLKKSAAQRHPGALCVSSVGEPFSDNPNENTLYNFFKTFGDDDPRESAAFRNCSNAATKNSDVEAKFLVELIHFAVKREGEIRDDQADAFFRRWADLGSHIAQVHLQEKDFDDSTVDPVSLHSPTTGALSVTVKDTSGILPGVTCTAVSAAGASEVRVSNTIGRASFKYLSPGAYHVTCELEGFMPAHSDSIDVRRSDTAAVSLLMVMKR